MLVSIPFQEVQDSKRKNESLQEEIDKLIQGNNFNKSPQK